MDSNIDNSKNATEQQNIDTYLLPLISMPNDISPYNTDLISKENEEDVSSMICPICIFLVWKPVHCSKCTNLICSTCINKWLIKNKNCPLCKEVFVAGNLVNIVKSLLGKIKIKCHYSIPYFKQQDSVCNQVISYYNYENHLENCDFRPYKCKLATCNVEGPRFKMQNHSNECDSIKESCPHCTNLFVKRLIQSHLKVCEFKKEMCNTCGLNVLLKDYLLHKDPFECIKMLKNELSIKDQIINELKMQLEPSVFDEKVKVPTHIHELQKVKLTSKYECRGRNLFKISNCINKDPNYKEIYIFECQKCKGLKYEIKYCMNCVKRSDKVYPCKGHSHDLTLTEKNTGWGCDGRKLKDGCFSNNKTSGILRFRCNGCDFDLCEYCLVHYLK